MLTNAVRRQIRTAIPPFPLYTFIARTRTNSRKLFFLVQEPPSWPGSPHSLGFYITHNDTPQSVGLLWTSDQFVAETSTWQHTTITTDRLHAPRGIRTNNLSRWEAENLCLKPRGHWDRLRTPLLLHFVLFRKLYIFQLIVYPYC